MSVGTPFHPRTAPLNRKLQWREWSGYYASSAYADAHDIEYNAIREAAALIDVSPLYKYQVSGPDATRLIDRVITRDATKLKVGQVYYTPWCDEDGKVVDDGTIHRLDELNYRWTAADPNLRWLRLNARGLNVTIDDVSERVAAVALQGPMSCQVHSPIRIAIASKPRSRLMASTASTNGAYRRRSPSASVMRMAPAMINDHVRPMTMGARSAVSRKCGE